jgi:predicted MPP superfamily phosphohydrolase
MGGYLTSFILQFNPNVTVYDVARQMATTAKHTPPAFIINTGDNFYWCGLENTSDYQIEIDFVRPYDAKELDVTWYSILGNHEYGYNVQAQIDYAKMNKKWVMDDRYYTRRVTLAKGHFVTFIFIDTSPCIADYRSTNNKYWDPCGSMYPTCSLDSGTDDFEGKCGFHENIMTQSCDTQFAWFKAQLAKVPKDDWLIISGHHAADEIDVLDFTGAMQEHGFDLYLNGHAHTLSHYAVDGKGAYVTSGAGAMVNTKDQEAPHIVAKTSGQAEVQSPGTHKYSTVWNQKVPGFTSHTFSADYKTLTTSFVTFTGDVPHNFTVTKGVAPVPAPTPPHAPTPPPTPFAPTPVPGPSKGGCCHSNDLSCKLGEVCCKFNCTAPTTCSYTQSGCLAKYGQIHHCKWAGNKCVVGSLEEM